MQMRQKTLFRLFLVLLLALLAAGVLLTVLGLREYDRTLRLPRREETAILRCFWPRIVA